jgi:hypothetical protein
MSVFRRTLVLAAAFALAGAAAAAPVRAQSPGPVPVGAAAPAAPSRPADAVPMRELRGRDLDARMLIGMGFGVALGAPAGAVYGYARFEPCGDECLLSRGMETMLYGLMGASAGGLLGSVVGALWPGRRPAVAVAPDGRGGLAVGLALAR